MNTVFKSDHLMGAAFTASDANRMLMMKERQVYKELERSTKARKAFFDAMIHVLSTIGGETSHVV